MSMDTKTLSLNIADPGADEKIYAFRAPDNGDGGGVTILSAYAINGATLAGPGTTFTFALHRYSNAGTPAVNGTISNTIGSATQWTADVPQTFTIDDTYSFLDAGEWLVLDYAELNAANASNAHVIVHYVLGR